MQSIGLCFCIILLMWKIVCCKDADFTEDTEHRNVVNPYSLDYDRTNKRMVVERSIEFPQCENTCVGDDQCRKQLKQCKYMLATIQSNEIYITRLINLLISTAKLKEKGDLLTGSITLSGTKEQFQELEKFKTKEITVQQVDAIFSNLITPTTNILEETLTWIDSLHVVIHRYGAVSAVVLGTVGILLLIKYVDWSTGKVIIVFLAAGFLISFFTMWSQLMKEAELKHLVKRIKQKEPPIQCQPEKMSIWNRIATYYDDDDQCFEFYKALEFNAFQEVTPVDAFVEVLDRLIVQPLVRAGTAIGRIIENATKPLGYPMRWIVTIMLYLLIPFFIFALLGGRLRIWLTPYLGLSVGGGQGSWNQQKVPMTEQRNPGIHYIIERDSVAELKHIAASAVAQAIEDKKLAIGDGDTKTQKQETKSKNSEAMGAGCCCKNSENKSHIQEGENVASKPSTSKVQSDENGHGDC